MASLTLRHYALVFACFITATFAWGLGFYSFGFYLDALQKVQGWPTGVAAGTVAVHSLITGAAGILVGRWLTRLGPRTVLLGGSLAMAVGSYGIGYLTLLEAETAVWLVLFPFALAGAGFAASSTSALTTALIHRFDRGLGLAMGVALSGASAGGALMPPLLAWLSQNYDYHRALAMVCGAMVLVAWPLVILFIDGLARRQVRRETTNETMAVTAETPRIGGLMARAAFWRIAISATFAMVPQVTLFMHMLPALELKLGLVNAAFAVSLAAIAAVAGRLLIGNLTLRINVFWLAMACYLTQGIGIAIAALGTAPWMHYAGVAVAGLVVGAIVMLTLLMINRTFSKESFPIAYCWVAAMMQSTAFLTAITVGWLRDAMGDYLVGFMVLAAMHCARRWLFRSGEYNGGGAVKAKAQ